MGHDDRPDGVWQSGIKAAVMVLRSAQCTTFQLENALCGERATFMEGRLRCAAPQHEAGKETAMTSAITLQDVTIQPVVEQQGPFFDVLEFFPTLTKELLEENRSWLQPAFIDPASGRLVLCVQGFVV